MNEGYVDIERIKFPKVEDGISIKDIKGMDLSFRPTYATFKNVIAECDKNTLLYIKNVLKSLENSIISSKGVARLAYIEMHKQLLKKITSYTLVKPNTVSNNLDNIDNELDTTSNELEMEIFSKPEIHQMEEVDFETTPLGDELSETEDQNFTTLKNEEEPYNPLEEDNKTIDVVHEDMGYKKDPSQDSANFEKNRLLQKLQQINSEGRIFTDESRITDNNLNINNAISLGKINLSSLNVDPSKKQQVNVKNTKILEMGNTKFKVLKNAFVSFNKKLEPLKQNIKEFPYKIKKGLICRYNQIHQINIENCTIAEMPKKLSEKISTGSKIIASRVVDKALSTNDKIKDQLIKWKENLIDEETNVNDEMEHAKAM